MATEITVTTAPALVALVRPPYQIICEFSSADYVINQGANEFIDFEFNPTAEPAATNTLTISWDENTEVFTFANTDTNDGLWLPLRGASSWEDYQDELFKALSANVPLILDYRVLKIGSGNQAKLRLFAREKYNFTAYIESTVSNFPTPSQTAGASVQTQENYKGNLQLWIYDQQRDSSPRLQTTLSAKPSISGGVGVSSFELAQYLDAFTSCYLPIYGATGFFAPEGSVVRYYWRPYESYGLSPSRDYKLGAGSAPEYGGATNYALRGRGSTNEFLANEDWLMDGYVSPSTGRKFLTRQSTMQVLASQAQYLYFWTGDESTQLRLSVTAYYTDGTSHTESQAESQLPQSEFSPLNNMVVGVAVGVNQIGIMGWAASAGKTLSHYDISVYGVGVGQTMSETYTIEVAPNPSQPYSFLFFENDFGFLESVYCPYVSTGFEFERSTYKRSLEFGGNNLRSATVGVDSVGTKQQINLHTHAMTQKLAEPLEKQILQSRECFMIDNELGDFVPLTMEGTTINPAGEETQARIIIIRAALAQQNA